MNTVNTKGFLILDEATFTIVKGKTKTSDNQALFFKNEDKANLFAADRLEMWQIIPVNFNHRFIHHETNM
jgi:hypothetical protein